MMRLSLCHLPFDAIVGMLLVGCGAASGQSVASGSPSLQARIEAVARALQDAPRLKNLSEQERIDRVEFVVGNTLFILLHELGHLHLSDMHLAGIGREEDEADTFAAVTLLKIGTSFSQRVLADASQGWFLRQRRNQQKGAKPPYYDQHDISAQRAYQIVCLMVGSDPVKFKSVADEAKMPKWRQQSCKYDYAKESRSWDMVLAPYLRSPEQPETKINIIYGDAQGIFGGFPRTFQALQILETVAERSASKYAWSAPFTMEMLSCDRGPNASWNDETRTLKVCYQLPFDLAELYRVYVPVAAPRAIVNQKRKRKLT